MREHLVPHSFEANWGRQRPFRRAPAKPVTSDSNEEKSMHWLLSFWSHHMEKSLVLSKLSMLLTIASTWITPLPSRSDMFVDLTLLSLFHVLSRLPRTLLIVSGGSYAGCRCQTGGILTWTLFRARLSSLLSLVQPLLMTCLCAPMSPSILLRDMEAGEREIYNLSQFCTPISEALPSPLQCI